MDISTVSTNFSGLLPDVRVVTLNEWSDKYFKAVKALMPNIEITEARGIAGQWIIHLKTNNAHIQDFFRKNFTHASLEPRPDLFCYAFTGIEDTLFLRAFHDARTEPAMEILIEKTLKDLSLQTYREGLGDSELQNFAKLSANDKETAALRKPTAMYVPELNLFVMVNVNCYQVLRSQGCFGVLKRYILSKVPTEEEDEAIDLSSFWFPLNASAVEVVHSDSQKYGMAFLSTDAALKASIAITLTEQIDDAKFISSELVYVNPGKKKMVPVEKNSYLPGSAIAKNLGLLPSVLSLGFENLKLDEKTAESLDDLDSSLFHLSAIEDVLPKEALASLRESLPEKGVYGLFDPMDFWPQAKTSTSADLDVLFVTTSDHEDNRILTPISKEEAIELLTAKNNVQVYGGNDIGGGHPEKLQSRTVPWFDDHLINPFRGSWKWETEKQRVLMEELMSGDLRLYLLNARIPFNQLGFCLLNNIIGDISSVEIKTAEETDRVLCAKLRLFRRISRKGGRDVLRLYSTDGTEVNVLSFKKTSGAIYYAALDPNPEDKNQVKSYSRGTVADFFKLHSETTAQTVLQHFR
ncbi:MAG TPA: hypothetical protein VMY18_06040 [Acidobacteriota bacterium]|nr:hypothetical protein [Acidobacteriota bacterium]